jgi:hypothetical protein
MRKLFVAILAVTFAGSAAAQPAPAPPAASAVCPAIEEDGLLCSDDPMSENCEAFVSDADRLGALYRSELEELPDSRTSLLATNWWGCGPNSLAEVKALLVRIGTPQALAVLQREPYPSLPGAPPPPPTGPADPQLRCDDLTDPAERDACIELRLRAARAKHQRALARCRGRVAPGLRDDLAHDEASFKALLPARCDAEAAGAPDQDSRAFVRSRCLVQALEDNTRGMLAAHPECAEPN